MALHLTLLHTNLILLWISPLLLGLHGLGLLATGLLGRHALLSPAASSLGTADMLAGLPLWEAGYALYHLTIAPMGLLAPPDEW